MVRTAVLVSGGGTNLQAILASKLFGEIQNCHIVAVISSNQNAYALDRARAANLDTSVVDISTFPTKRNFNTALAQKLKDLDVALVVLAGFSQDMLQRPIIKEYENRIINVHPSLFPAFCDEGCQGEALHQMVLDQGVKITGATVYFVAEEMAQSPIILQKSIEVLPNDTAKSLGRRVTEEAEWELLPRAIALFCAGKLKTTGRQVVIEET